MDSLKTMLTLLVAQGCSTSLESVLKSLKLKSAVGRWLSWVLMGKGKAMAALYTP